MDVWRCSECKKAKELSGKHLEGKTTVRSDCWPCAKKCTFVRESPTAFRGAAQVVTAPFLFNPVASMASEGPLAMAAAPAAAAATGAALNPFTTAAAFLKKSPFSSTPQMWKGTVASSNPFAAAAATSFGAAKQPGTEAATRANVFSRSQETSPIVMHSVSSADRPRQSPPFTFTSTLGAAMSTVNDNATAKGRNSSNGGNRNDAPVWSCSVCKKAKELSGKHLEGKTTVRSDCWPCAKKCTFILSHPEPCVSLEAFAPLPFSMAAIVPTSPPNAAQSAHIDVRDTSPMTSMTSVWQPPVVPTNDQEVNTFVINRGSQGASITDPLEQREKLVSSESVHPSSLLISLAQTFEGEVLRGYRRQLVDGIHPRTAWHKRTLYVLAHENCGDKHLAAAGVSQLGDAAVVFLAVEHKLALSPLRHMRRIFCPDEFTFAAACMYADTFLTGQPTNPRQSSFVVYGPQVDRTVPMTRWGPIIEGCIHAQQRVVSGEQRVEGAQSIFRHSGWLTLPLHATAEAIRLSEMQPQGDTTMVEADSLGVDVVLLAKTMQFEELPQAAALALPVKPF
ncbi:hypothetical protein TraAM80_04563 [Trypanosoma rangeli]|uniref:Uncharacterized protein n=1 Tax=Trypanosoma rangeli TaxID=5698 RepID=A0A3R7MGF3_TRYRA|nr:uncharacterized protein TraAM80_04563 [Trypanosoma rangeli]RNF05364.1 hypothetical protein TraAM80_04563 [Trypanosoma rangeli]|eukprot:RNF05364.1 hypothetical protein TraAM80_04563 [Trypanosoma rangeli]